MDRSLAQVRQLLAVSMLLLGNLNAYLQSSWVVFRKLFLQAKEAEAKNPKRKTDIPIPTVSDVGTYERDYLPTFQRQPTYIRGRGQLSSYQVSGMRVTASHGFLLNLFRLPYRRSGPQG